MLATDTLAKLRQGELVDELTTALQHLVGVCADTGKKGSLTLKLTLQPGKAGQIEIHDELAVKEPKQEKGTSIMFATPEGNLVREDPRQKKLALEVVDRGTGEIIKVG